MIAIEAKGKDQLSGIIAEARQIGDEDDILQAWQRDVTSQKEFFNDKLRNLKCNINTYLKKQSHTQKVLTNCLITHAYSHKNVSLKPRASIPRKFSKCPS